MQVSIKGLLAPLAVAVMIMSSTVSYALFEARVPLTQVSAGGISAGELPGRYTATGNVNGNAVSVSFTVTNPNVFQITAPQSVTGTFTFSNGVLVGTAQSVRLTVDLSNTSAASLRGGASLPVTIVAAGDTTTATFTIRKL